MGLVLYSGKAYRPEVIGVIRDLKPTWALEELELAYERRSLDPLKKENFHPDYLALNPFGKVPTLTDGEFVIFESAAIVEYLAEKAGRLRPLTPTGQWKMKQWNYCAVTNLEPQAFRFFSAERLSEKNETSQAIRRIASEALHRFLPILETLMARQNFILGDEFSISDILMVSSLYPVWGTEIFAPYSNLTNYMKRSSERPAFQRAHQINGT